MNPYEILGLSREATKAEIKLAFRQLSKFAHPDHGGDEEAFKRLEWAHRLLTDADRRRRYDETGLTDEEVGPDSQVLSLLVKTFQMIVSEAMQGGHDVAIIDFVLSARLLLEKRMDDITKFRCKTLAAIATLERLAGRFSSTNGPSVFDAIYRSEIDRLTESLKSVDTDLTIAALALKRLETESYRSDPPPNQPAVARPRQDEINLMQNMMQNMQNVPGWIPFF